MAPPGRRRAGVSIFSACLLFLFFSHSVHAAAAVLGIDLGTEYIKAVLVKPGIPLEIVLSKDSKRKEPSIVAFKTPKGVSEKERIFPERSYGSAAQALAARFPSDVYANLKQLLGLPLDTSSVVKEYQTRYPELSLVKIEGRGTAAFKSRSFKYGETPFAVEELLAMTLKEVVENAQSLAGKSVKVRNVVFTVPAFYTIEEKSALELAAKLANLNVLGLISDGLAVGTNYATSRKFSAVEEGSKPEYHMVFDVGAGNTVATVLAMQSRSVKDVGKFNKTIQEVIVKGTGWDRTLGGDALNRVILDDMAKQFVESPAGKKLGKSAQDVLANGRATARLWKDSEKVRQVLSANQATSASFEELYGDVDFRYKLTRADFEAQTESFAERLAAPFNEALKAAKLSAADLESVILHGGAIRTPFIQKKLESLIGDKEKIRSNVNSDEAAAFGAAFKAASLSPSFRVKEIRGHDASVYPTWIEYKTDSGKTKQQKLFTPSSFVGSSKVITLSNQQDFEIYMFQKRPTDAGSPFESTEITNSGTRYKSQKLTDHIAQLVKDHGCRPENITTKVTLRLNPVWGLPEVQSGTVSCDYENTEKAGVMDNVKDFLGFGQKGDDSQKVLKDDSTDESSSKSSSTSVASSSSSSSASAKASGSKKTPLEKAKSTKKKIETKTLNFDFEAEHDQSTVIPWVEHKFIAERLRAFDQSDYERVIRETNLNNLESYLYKARDLVEDTAFTTFGSGPMIKDISKVVKSTSSWLSDNADAKSEVLVEKLKAITDLVNPIKSRKEEATQLPEQTELLRSVLQQSKTLIGVIRDTIEAASKSAASLAAEVTETAEEALSSASSAVVGESSPDPLADLEHEEPSTSSSSSASAKPSEAAEPGYSPEDLKSISDTYESVEIWLESKLAEQAKLKPWEDLAVKPGELQRKGKELNEALMKILSKKLKSQKPPKWSNADTKKAEKAAKEALAKARARAKEGTNQVKSKAGEAAESVKSAAGKATESIKSVAGEATQSAKSATSIKDEL